MPVNLNVGVFADNLDGAFRLRKFILGNRSIEPGYAVSDLIAMDEKKIMHNEEQDQRFLGSILSCISTKVSNAYEVGGNDKNMVNRLFANGGIFISVSNIAAQVAGSVTLSVDLTPEFGQDGTVNAFRFASNESHSEIVPAMGLVHEIVDKIAHAAGIKAFSLLKSPAVHVIAAHGRAGLWMYISSDVCIDSIFENHIEEDVDTLKMIIKEVLDARLLQSVFEPNASISPIIVDARAASTSEVAAAGAAISERF